MKALLRKPIVIGAIAFFLGGLTVWSAIKLYESSEKTPDHDKMAAISDDQLPNFDEFFGRDFFKQSRNPFKEMERLHGRMLKDFGIEDETDHFDSWFQKSFGGGNPSDFNTREDGDFVYYEIDASGGVPKKVDVKVDQGQVTITGEIEKKEESGGSASQFSSTFVRSFPAPEHVDAQKFVIENQEHKIVIKFPKLKASSVSPGNEGSI